jgi:Protein of unknown function (DUF3102)
LNEKPPGGRPGGCANPTAHASPPQPKPQALPDLAQAIDREHQAAHQAARTALEHALECGRLLIQAKAAVPHGGWLPWLEANTTVSARQSQRYMRLATAAIEGKYDATSHLTIEGALALLAAPMAEQLPEPEPVRMTVYLAESRPLEDEEIRIPVTDVLLAPKVARRSTVYPEYISRLAKYLPHLPPIEINQRKELIDGWHRLEAHKLAGAKTICAVVTEVASELHHIELFCERNCGHGGYAYTLEDEAHQDQQAAQLGINLAAVREEASREALAKWRARRRAGDAP